MYIVSLNRLYCIELSAKKGGIGTTAFQTSNTTGTGFKVFCDDDPHAQSSLPRGPLYWGVANASHRTNYQKGEHTEAWKMD